MKIKYNSDKDTFNIKNLTGTQFDVIYALMQHVLLGTGNIAADAALDFLNEVENLLGSDYDTELQVHAECPDDLPEGVDIMIKDPVLSIYA